MPGARISFTAPLLPHYAAHVTMLNGIYHPAPKSTSTMDIAYSLFILPIMNKNQTGSMHVMIIMAVVLVALVGIVGWRVSLSQTSKATSGYTKIASNKPVMKSIGFKLDYYDPKTNSAGDMVFTKIPLPYDEIWGDFGQQDPRAPNDPTKRNPQPTYILPLGTKVLALVDGTVSKVETLYSGDMTIWVTPENNSSLNFETEHVSNPVVKVGDKVQGGQIIADVSPHDSQNHAGFGILEIGVLGGDGKGKPEHTCPYQYLDPSIKDETLKKIKALYGAWENYLGKPNIYDQDKFAMPGCVTLEPFSG